MEKNNSNDIYAILFGLIVIIVVFFILTISFWSNTIYHIFLFDNQIAIFINNLFPQYFTEHLNVYNIIQYVDLPKFEWLKLKFTDVSDNGYIDIIYQYYYYLHIIYGSILIFFSYLMINNFHLIPIFKFQNYILYKKKLVEEAKNRVKIYNKKIVLYKHMNVLLEKKREAAEIGNSGQFLNADYYLPFISDDMIGSNANSDNIKDNFIDVNIINTNRRYINDSLYFSNHYINFYYHEYILQKIEVKNNTIIALKKMELLWNSLKEKIIKNNNIQDLYYYNIINYYNDDIKNINDTFISLFLLNIEDLENKNYLVLFNNFLKKYKIDIKLIYKYYNNSIEKKISPYIITTNKSEYRDYKEMQKYEFIIENKYILTLEEFYIFLKIKLFSFSVNKTYFFNSNEEKITSPILNIPPSEKTKVESHKKNEIENIKTLISSLENIHIKEFGELETIKNNIDEYNEFKNSYLKCISFIYETNEENISFQNKLLNLLNKTIITTEKKQLLVKNILNHQKYNYDYFYNIFSQTENELELYNYLKNIKLFIQNYYKKCQILYKENTIDKSFLEDLEDIKSHYKLLAINVQDLFEDKDNLKDIIEIEKRYLNVVIKELQNFMEKMINKIKLYFKYNLQYNMENENEVIPEIGQPIMPTFYILTPFEYYKEKNDNSNFEKIKKFKVNGYKKYIYPVFEEIYNKWYNNIEDLIDFYDKKLKKEESIEITLRLELLKREANRQKTTDSSIETKLLNIFEIHKYEETIIIALWKTFTKLENLPTTKLSNLKYDNLVLWYALTCIGDIGGNIKSSVIGRPFDYNAGLPILLMYELEIEQYKRKLNSTNNTNKHNIEEKE